MANLNGNEYQQPMEQIERIIQQRMAALEREIGQMRERNANLEKELERKDEVSNALMG